MNITEVATIGYVTDDNNNDELLCVSVLGYFTIYNIEAEIGISLYGRENYNLYSNLLYGFPATNDIYASTGNTTGNIFGTASNKKYIGNY